MRQESVRGASKPKKRTRALPRASRAQGWRGALPKRPVRTLVSGLFGALLCGIIVNAVALQHSRRPGPLSLHRIRALGREHALRAIAPAPPPRPADFETKSRSESRPVEQAASRSVLAPAHKKALRPRQDQIGELIATGEPPAEHKRRKIEAVQAGLRRLGFVVPQSGTLGLATRQALEKFERDRRLPISGRLSPRVVEALAKRSGETIPK
ncbi:MAG TPA: peptidoglycan-binding protein [Beijerinckiaceae bacterium]|nr:peptidoglycan-binding protein [Beijerinckiaceae bacterium]